MNFLKRAVFSLWHHKKNTLILFSVFFVIAVLILSGFSMLEACRAEEKTMRESIGATVTVGTVYNGANLIPEEKVAPLAQEDNVTGYNPYVLSMARGTIDITPYATPEQKDLYGSMDRWFRVDGTLDVASSSGFLTGAQALSDGRLFEEDDVCAAVISDAVAQDSGVKIGDKVHLETVQNLYGGEDVEVTIVGTYSLSQALPHTNAPYYNSENQVYTTPDAAMQLFGPEGLVYNARFTVRDPERAGELVEKLQALHLPEEDNLQYTIDDLQYRAIRGTIGSMTGMATAMLLASCAIGGITLVMLLLIELNSRDFEMGVLLSMGESKVKIVLQLISESLFPVLAATTAAIFASPAADWAVNQLFTGSLTAPVSATGASVSAMYLCGVALTLAASAVTAYKVARYEPKKALMAAG